MPEIKRPLDIILPPRNLGNVGRPLHACYAPVHVGKSAACKEWTRHACARASALSRDQWPSRN